MILWGFYKITLEQQAAHQFKRFYLLGSLVLALALPLITLNYSVAVEPQQAVEQVAFDTIAVTDEVNTSIEETIHWIPILIGSIYAAGVLLFGFRFLGNLYRLRQKVTHNERVKSKSHINVLLLEKIVPHSFLSYIFLPKNDFKNNAIAPEVLAHEQAHVTQKHSWDILFIEFLQVVFWFNPLLILLKKSIALNHEFLADSAALSQNKNLENYTNLLFTYSGGSHHTALSSPINYSLTKKRIIMLSKTRSVKKLATRLALFVPVLACCIYLFNQEIVAKPVSVNIDKQTDLLNTQTNSDSLALEYYNTSSKKSNLLLKKFIADNLIDHSSDDSIATKKITGRFKGETFNGKNPTKSQIDRWIKDGFKLSINSKISSPEDLNKYKASDFEIYSGVKTVDTVTGKMVNAYVNLFTNKYYEDVNRKRIQSKNPDSLAFEYYKASSKKQVLLDTVRHQEYPTLKIRVEDESVWVNGESTSIENFAQTINMITKDWSKSDMMNYSLQLKSQNGVDKFVGKLTGEFKKTNIYKTNPSRQLIPPPPPPAPAVPEGQLPPPPPPPLPADPVYSNAKEEVFEIEVFDVISIDIDKDNQVFINNIKIDENNIEEALNKYNTRTSKEEREQFLDVKIKVDPDIKMGILTDVKSALRSYGIKKISITSEPVNFNKSKVQKPTQEQTPVAMINTLKENNGTAYYNGKKISYEAALSLMNKKKDLQILLNENKGKGTPDLIIKD
ncbi:M56 family metallopeptidase [Leeuwenhoekiella sp. NPDC079379]|uniref:M56 family metallopeptidase n=1 Tax=Leeuwenhoekiella sp. NPDC079379 TaxID=3364122 RepID=UPI0037C8D38D